MPRRYRPPTRRRKSKKQRFTEDAASPAYEDAVAPVTPPRRVAPAARPQEQPSGSQHIARDHSYVLGELRLISLIVAFITAGLIVTAILR